MRKIANHMLGFPTSPVKACGVFVVPQNEKRGVLSRHHP